MKVRRLDDYLATLFLNEFVSRVATFSSRWQLLKGNNPHDDMLNGEYDEPLGNKVCAEDDALCGGEWGAKAVEGEGGIGDDEEDGTD